MLKRSPTAISAALTVVLLVLLAMVLVFLQIVVLNGASERQTQTALGVMLGCQSLVVILFATLAARVTTFLLSKGRWDSVPAVIMAVIAATMIGGAISFLSMIVSIAGIGLR